MKKRGGLILVIFFLVLVQFEPFFASGNSLSIVVAANGTKEEFLAAKELRKYIYLRSDVLAQIIFSETAGSVSGDAIIIGVTGSGLMKSTGFSAPPLAKDAFVLKTVSQKGAKQLIVCGGSPVGTLYAAYHLAEQLGIGFYLDGDVIPDRKIPFVMPDLDVVQTPFFERRGIQPFHDFPEGPDWWNLADYKAVFAQLPKLKMNFFGLHTYPEGGVGPEPLTWIGLPGDANTDGTVRTAYHARHFTTQSAAWGYQPAERSVYSFGAGQLLNRSDFGAEYMHDRAPWPKPEDEINLFNDMGKFLADGFSFAGSLGIKSCIGTEIPLVLPTQFIELLKNRGLDPETPEVRQKIYEGIFSRIKKTHPLDFYWFWTNENWTWKGDSKEDLDNTIRDFDAAQKAWEVVQPGFKLATCGWVLGPVSDRALFDKYLSKSVAFSCINRNLGWEPVDTAFVRISDREKWAIPWLEDDPGMTIPQFWVGRMRRDAADAYAYGCNGYFGIHWRTRGLSMNVSALAKASWEQPWNPERGKRINADQVKPYLVAMEGKDRKIRDMECLDFYRNWCNIQFGAGVAEPLALIFAGLDGVKEKTVKLDAGMSRLPRPATWGNGPGNLTVNVLPWDSIKGRYAFIDSLEKIRSEVVGSGNLERFDYWLNQFKYLKSAGKLGCSLGLFKVGIQMMNNMSTDEKKLFAGQKLLPLFRQEVKELEDVHKYLVATISTWGEVGTLCNWQQHLIPTHLYPQIKEIVKITGDSAWVPAIFPAELKEIRRIIVPSPETVIQKGRDYTVKVLTFNVHPVKAMLNWRLLGEKEFRSIELVKTDESQWLGTIPSASMKNDFEYFIEIKDDREYRYPASSPQVNFAVVRW